MNQKDPTAYQFRADLTEISSAATGSRRSFSGIAYTGQPLRHPYWGMVMFDLSTTRAANAKTPVLRDHDPSKRCGFASLSFDNHQIAIADGTLLDNEYGREIASESDQGFPWQMSVYIDPGRIDELQPGTSASVNGQTVQGPATIFRDAIIREVSFTAIGVDYDTHATAMSQPRHYTNPPPSETSTMTIEELQAQIAEMKTSLAAAEQRAETAENQLTAQRTAARQGEVKALFSALGREMSDTAAAPYLAMDDATFSAVAADLKAAKPAAPQHLFAQHATAGQEPTPPAAAPISAAAIYANRSK